MHLAPHWELHQAFPNTFPRAAYSKPPSSLPLGTLPTVPLKPPRSFSYLLLKSYFWQESNPFSLLPRLRAAISSECPPIVPSAPAPFCAVKPLTQCVSVL